MKVSLFLLSDQFIEWFFPLTGLHFMNKKKIEVKKEIY
mgnify:CR=1 FL=1